MVVIHEIIVSEIVTGYDVVIVDVVVDVRVLKSVVRYVVT